MGQAISKAVAIAEIIKKRIHGLHQNISTSSTTITDAYEPIEEGLNPLEMKRQVSLISITLSTVELNKDSPGYQAPVVKQQQPKNLQQQQQTKQSIVSPAAVGEDDVWNRRPVGGRGRGGRRGRGRGRGRGGYVNNYQENDGYYNWGRGGGRGRGWGYGGAGYGRGRGRGSGRGYGYGRGRTGGRGWAGGNQA
ncbi:hypothetical protein CDL12_16990 [Handroanthus impetiginosus]|uniref:DNA/RNA-binding protein Alba-like domain-containing protein n=1 Tax=Handroanthus impetiginosus TaxID=429701 RepID=A0A2G9GYX5_9LAMI|nr:hypothetical protein CDL12_16990 [Handroanthus impetiginosus]